MFFAVLILLILCLSLAVLLRLAAACMPLSTGTEEDPSIGLKHSAEGLASVKRRVVTTHVHVVTSNFTV